MRIKPQRLRVMSAGVMAMGAASFAGPLRAIADPTARWPPASGTMIRVARSADGMTFRDTGDIFATRAAAANVIALPNGSLLAAFDLAAGDGASASTMLMTSRSMDGGQTWSRAKEISLKGARFVLSGPRHGRLVAEGRGRVRLYLTADPVDRSGRRRRDARRNGRHATLVFSALSADGERFRLDLRTRLRFRAADDVYSSVVRLGKRTHLYVANARSRAGDKTQRGDVHHYVSRDGHSFDRLRPIDPRQLRFVGSIVPVADGMRAYVSSGEGVVSLVSKDGRDWSREPGIRLRGGWHPSVVKLADGSYLMLYSAELEDSPAGQDALVETPFDAPDRVADGSGGDANDSGAASGQEEGLDESGGAALDGSEQVAAGESGDEVGEEGAVEAADVEDSAEARWGADGEPWTDEDWVMEVDESGFAPQPDFKSKVDYYEWYKRYAIGHPVDNAYFAYMSFMPALNDPPGSKPEWPKFNNMFDRDYEGPPIPWDAESNPEWEASNAAAQDLLEKFREASTHEGYASPPDLSALDVSGFPDGEELLLGLLLPSLSPHRQMVKATLADAWRKEDGKVSSSRMLAAWRTSLRAAAHLDQGATLIEELVSAAEHNQVQETARWALKHDVFSEDELQSALDTLREFDTRQVDPMESVRGEHGFAMDMTQYLFTPPTPEGEPKINLQRAKGAASMWESPPPETFERYARLTAQDAHDTIEAFDAFYRELGEQMSIGYPSVRAADVDAITDRYMNATPIMELLTPNLSRVHHLRAREEASRRATQLSYATHIFKAKNGRWPASLDELPPEFGQTMRTDPFSGEYFRYQLTADGPRIYTVSEDGLDSGGVHASRWYDEPDPETGSDDHVYWPPQE